MNDLHKFKGIQELLDEIIGPTTVVRESNSEVVWRLWDEAVKQLDEQSSMRIARASNPHCAGYPPAFLVDGSELK